MNAPQPTPAQPVKASLPTLGSVIGAAGASTLAAKLHITDPVNVGLLVTVVTSCVTALFHWLSTKMGVTLE